MHESDLRIFLLISAGAVVSGLIGWLLDKRFTRSKWRDAFLTGLFIYIALTVDSIFAR
jgi:high-affinity Fe2+/Pb2+ permease